MLSRSPAIAAAIALAAAAPTIAAGPLLVSTRMLVEKRVPTDDGAVRTELVVPKNVVPGDRVTIVLSYRNTSTRPIENLVLANPVPAGMVYRAGGTGSPAPELSVDGHSFAALAALRVATVGGPPRPATTADVVQVRWRLPAPVAPGTGGELSFQAVLK